MTGRARPVVAIDGPAGVGKSTTARELARRLGYTLVDTGALYRGVALAAEEHGIAWNDADALSALAGNLQLGFADTDDGSSRLLIDGVDRSLEIRTPHISQGASQVSAHPGVRQQLLGIQRGIGQDGGVVLEGRDIGTVVFPDAEVKVFLVAQPKERARRRVGDLETRGMKADQAEILKQIEARDGADANREVAPLKPAEDAVVLDTTELDFETVVSRLEQMVQRCLTP